MRDLVFNVVQVILCIALAVCIGLPIALDCHFRSADSTLGGVLKPGILPTRIIVIACYR